MSGAEFRRWHLEQTAAQQLPRSAAPDGAALVHAELPSPTLNRYFYGAVGGDWKWKDRLSWSPERWQAHVQRSELQTWLLQLRGTPVGYAELEQQDGGTLEIAYFGLLKEFTGRGLGGWFLAEILARAWQQPGTRRVWVHTCSYDHPAARANYEARGMRVFKTEDRY